MERIIRTTFYCLIATSMLISCGSEKEEETPPPAQDNYTTLIIGKWKHTMKENFPVPTNNKYVKTFYMDGRETSSISTFDEKIGYIWANKAPYTYTINGNMLYESPQNGGRQLYSNILSVTDKILALRYSKNVITNGPVLDLNYTDILMRVTKDYTKDIIGLWEGVEITGDETFGDANHRIEYKADGTYTYYENEDGQWVKSTNVDNEYNVDGDWLATRWRPEAGADFRYERWDIDEIKDGLMKWSALREKSDGTQFTTTFTWKRVIR